jgi:hypothetical protein
MEENPGFIQRSFIHQPNRFLDEFRAIGETYKSRQADIEKLNEQRNEYGEAGPRILLYIYKFLSEYGEVGPRIFLYFSKLLNEYGEAGPRILLY